MCSALSHACDKTIQKGRAFCRRLFRVKIEVKVYHDSIVCKLKWIICFTANNSSTDRYIMKIMIIKTKRNRCRKLSGLFASLKKTIYVVTRYHIRSIHKTLNRLHKVLVRNGFIILVLDRKTYVKQANSHKILHLK